MFDLFKEMITQFKALPMPVLLWVSWMGFIFALAFFYAHERKAARFAILTFFVFTFLGAGIAFYFMGSIHWIAVIHLIVWPPLLYYLLVPQDLSATPTVLPNLLPALQRNSTCLGEITFMTFPVF